MRNRWIVLGLGLVLFSLLTAPVLAEQARPYQGGCLIDEKIFGAVKGILYYKEGKPCTTEGIIIPAPPGDIIPRSWKTKVAKYKIKLCPNGWFGGEINWKGKMHFFRGKWEIRWMTTYNNDQYPVLVPCKVPCKCLALIVDGTC